MMLLERLKALNARLFETYLRAVFEDGAIMEGLLTDYGDADDNENGRASINLRSESGQEFVLFENQISSLHIKN